MFFNEGFTSFHLHWVERIDFSNFGGKVWMEFDGVVIGTMGRKLVMGLFREDICKVFAPFWDDWFHRLGVLGNLGGDGGLVDLFPF